MGVIPRALKEFLRRLVDSEDTKVEISYYEIYNKKVYDLLSCNKVVLHVKGDMCDICRMFLNKWHFRFSGKWFD